MEIFSISNDLDSKGVSLKALLLKWFVRLRSYCQKCTVLCCCWNGSSCKLLSLHGIWSRNLLQPIASNVYMCLYLHGFENAWMCGCLPVTVCMRNMSFHLSCIARELSPSWYDCDWRVNCRIQQMKQDMLRCQNFLRHWLCLGDFCWVPSAPLFNFYYLKKKKHKNSCTYMMMWWNQLLIRNDDSSWVLEI